MELGVVDPKRSTFQIMTIENKLKKDKYGEGDILHFYLSQIDEDVKVFQVKNPDVRSFESDLIEINPTALKQATVEGDHTAILYIMSLGDK